MKSDADKTVVGVLCKLSVSLVIASHPRFACGVPCREHDVVTSSSHVIAIPTK
jgi:hypothetical protein